MKKAILLICALVALLTAAALSAYGALEARASAAPSKRDSATRTASKTVSGAIEANSSPSQGVLELASNEGLDPSTLKPVATARAQHPAVVFATSRGTATCAYLTGGTGAVGGCMQRSTDLVTPRVAIVDGGTYVWGLANPTVTSIDARVGGQRFGGSVTGGVFVAEIPDGSHGTGPIDLAVTSNDSTTTLELPGIPTPLP